MIGDPLATGTEEIEIVGGPRDGQRMALPSPPPDQLLVPLATSVADLATLDHASPIPFRVATLERGAMNDHGVWRYHWRDPA